MKQLQPTLICMLATATSLIAETDRLEESAATLPTLYIEGQETANIRPVATYASPVSNLEFNPRVDFQSRNMAEAQGDVTIRGGIFENTGFRVGAATLVDPQTGHYYAELPIAPEMLTLPRVLVGAENALYGFNSSVGTIDYAWTQVQSGGEVTAGFGNNQLNFQRVHAGHVGDFALGGDWSWGVEAEYSRSESEGTVENGDHDFWRTSGRIQLLGPLSQTDFFAGYQEKFFAWPNMYTPFGDETENLKTRLFMVNHQQSYGADSQWEMTGYFRRHTDHYVLIPFNFNAYHETDVASLALAGEQAMGAAWRLHYGAQFTADSIESTTLEQGDYTDRSFYKLSFAPEYILELNSTDELSFLAGLAFDDTNRDDTESEFSPIASITWLRERAVNDLESLYLSFAQATQVPGYTAIGGSTGPGLFASNRDLGREISQNLELGTVFKRSTWSVEAAVFYRWDDDLVDWTYTGASNTARTANSVDVETFGIELIGTRKWRQFELIGSYAYLDKVEDYHNHCAIGSRSGPLGQAALGHWGSGAFAHSKDFAD